MAQRELPPLGGKIKEAFTRHLTDRRGSEGLAVSIFDSVLPKEGEKIPDAVRQVDLTKARGIDFVSGLLHAGAFWDQRIEATGERLKGERGNEANIRFLEDLRKVVGGVVQGEVASRAEREGGVEELSGGIPDYIDDKVFAELTDPKKNITGRREYSSLYSNIQTDVFKSLGVRFDSPLHRASIHIFRMYKDEGDIQVTKERQAIYTRAQVARFLQGSALYVERESRFEKREKTPPILRAARIDQELAEQYAPVLAKAIEGLGQDLNWTPQMHRQQSQELHKRQGDYLSVDPIDKAHEDFTSYLFDGINHEGKLSFDTNLAEVAGTQNKQQIASFARGKALQTIVEGGDIETYLTAMSVISSEKTRMADMAKSVWKKSAKDSTARRSLGGILLTVHAGELNPAELDEVRNEVIKVGEGEDKAKAEQAFRREIIEKVMSGVEKKVESTMASRDIEKPGRDSNAEAEFFESARSGKESNYRKAGVAIARQTIFGKALAGIAAHDLQPLANEFVDGKTSLLDVTDKAGYIQEVFDQMNYMNRAGGWGGLGKLTFIDGFPEKKRSLAARANFVRFGLSSDNVRDFVYEVKAYFKQAQELGILNGELVRLYNLIPVYLSAANNVAAGVFGGLKSHEALGFTDSLIMLTGQESNLTGVSFDKKQSNEYFKTYDHYSGGISGNWTYVAVDEGKKSGEVEQKEVEQINEKVRGSLEPVLSGGAGLARAHRLLNDEYRIERDEFLPAVVDQIERDVERRPGSERSQFAEDKGVKDNAERAKGLVNGIGDLDGQVGQLVDLGGKKKYFEGEINRWLQAKNKPAAKSRLEKLKYGFGYGEVAGERIRIETEMVDFTGRKIDLSGEEGRRKALDAVEIAAQEQRAPVAGTLQEKLQAGMAGVGGMLDRVDAFLAERTTPAYDPNNPDQVAKSLRVPVKKGEGKPVEEQEIDLATGVLGEDQYTPRHLLYPFIELFYERDQALVGPVGKALGTLSRKIDFKGLTGLDEAVKTETQKIGDSPRSAKVLVNILKVLIGRAIGKRLDEFDIDSIKVPEGKMKPGFVKEKERLQSALTRRHQA